MITNHSTATVLSGIKWVLFSLMAWQLIALLGIQARHHLLFGPERLLVALGSLITFGTTTLLVGVAAGHFLPAVLASGIVAALPFFMIPSGEVLRVPVGLLFVPGSAAGSIV